MKTFYLSLFCLFIVSPIHTQILKPEFETMFYFEDAVGNRDTIIAGYDPEANLDYNPDFGEIDISDTPFDSTFEVRAAHGFTWSDDNIIMTKKIVMWTEPVVINSDCISSTRPIFFINAKHLPGTFSARLRLAENMG